MEVRLQSWNFKPKGATEVMCSYFLKLVGLYQIQDPSCLTIVIKEKAKRKLQVGINATSDQSNRFCIEPITMDCKKKSSQVK